MFNLQDKPFHQYLFIFPQKYVEPIPILFLKRMGGMLTGMHWISIFIMALQRQVRNKILFIRTFSRQQQSI